ncbi:ABC transporter permease [[Clostridium] sordellii]|uniref:ABC-type transport system, permease n=1 Tax=Paraclostridium sordellii TaxID=1505 RepID=A0ABP1XMY4_PARSO|nr:FtsX-like permease family protein [Paeniclostridium sordellii]CEJ72686.1 ABC-type transport system, permease [[Clostridium] sordellii] [Paeniclostridium sordellii]CEN68239.1 ABC transporter permease [[Clostridium] sordellii] [Paeniclostridium sordellii]CEN71506.1 ABC transporter permease [[Clostridium] sordellii] [Paeniclostridium sordellii]CEO21571.1 ABC transporter permease [[Clostridium] sordellii] [Paeniclostridium sordellii]CEP76901.1 ABC transporter permease [[Clostridium] sordellii] 
MRKKLNLGLRYMQTYKARSFAIILSMVLSVAMIVGILTLTKIEDMNSLQTMKYNTGIYHTTFKNLNDKQLKIIENSGNLENVGAFNFHGITTGKEKQNVIMLNCNEDYIISNSKLEKGRFAKNKNEIVAEEWVLKNLGLEPKLNQVIKLNIEDTSKNIKDEEFKLVGIIKDRPTEKQIGKMQMYLPLQKNSENLEVGVAFNEKIDIPTYILELAKKANVNKDNITSSEDLITISRDANNISLNIVLSALVISLICGIVVYSIFNISMYKRFKEYGILRAIGARNFKVFRLILNELMTLSLIGIPIGTVLGIIASTISNKYASELKTNIALNGEIIKLHMIYPIVEIVLTTLFMIIILLLIAFFTYRKINKLSIIDAIKGNRKSDNMKRNIITVNTLRKYMKTYKAISFKNIWRNKKRCIMIILSMSICGILFINSNYKSHLDQSDDFIVDRSMFNNSDMRIDVYGTGNQRGGLSKEDINKIENIDGVKEVVKSQIMNGRMVMDEKDIAIKGYFENINKSSRGEGLFKGYLVKDKLNNELILKQNLRGYDDKALKELNNYLVEGSIDIERMKNEDLAVIYIPRVVDEKHGGKIEYNIVDNGKPVSDIKVGDTVKVKFREDGKRPIEFITLEDNDAKYIEKEFKVGAIVSYPFMAEDTYSSDQCIDVIVSDNKFTQVTGSEDYQAININLDKGVNDKKVYDEILKTTIKVNGAMARNIMEEKANRDAMYEKSRIYNAGMVVVLFIIAIVNIVNNISQSILDRTNEFGMLRAIGLNNKDFKKMIIFEGLIYTVISSLIIIVVSLVLNKMTYNSFEVSKYGIDFSIRYVDYILIIGINTLVGILTTYLPAKKLEKISVVEMVNINE